MPLSSFGHEDAASAAGPQLTESLARIVDNRAIRDFLALKSNKCYLIGPKGTGKTLLLIKKALEMVQEESVCVIPRSEDLPVDRLNGFEHLGHRFWLRHGEHHGESMAWATLWVNSICKASLYNVRQMLGSARGSARAHAAKRGRGGRDEPDDEVARRLLDQDIEELLGPGPYSRPKAVFDFYRDVTNRLDSAGTRQAAHLLGEIAKENHRLEHVLREISVPVYIFLDNLDVYHEHDPDLWFSIIFGQFVAIRAIRQSVRHVHVFTSIRRDIYNLFRTVELSQYRDYITFLEYSREELLRVLEFGIDRLDDELLAYPDLRKHDPWRAFFGEAATMTNWIVSRIEEPVQHYLLRHSLWRPRDLVTLGNSILTAKGDRRITEAIVCDAVAEAATALCRQYLTEIQPIMARMLEPILTPGFDVEQEVEIFVSRYLPGNILSCEQAREACRQHLRDRAMHGCGEDADCTNCLDMPLFTGLWSLGLIGAVKVAPATGACQQTFLKPGEAQPGRDRGRLPRSDWYLVHPVLDGLLGHQCVNPRQLVGYDLPFDPAAV